MPVRLRMILGGVFGNQFPHSRHQFNGHFYQHAGFVLHCLFSFGDGFIFCLLVVICDDALDAFLIPTGWKFILFFIVCLFSFVCGGKPLAVFLSIHKL